MDINQIWNKMIEFEDKEFYTKTGRPFIYQINNNILITSRTDYPLSKGNFAKALDYFPLDGPGAINGIVRGPSYVYAILMDKRIIKAFL